VAAENGPGTKNLEANVFPLLLNEINGAFHSRLIQARNSANTPAATSGRNLNANAERLRNISAENVIPTVYHMQW
jgi:hypothetical protein